jgi:hypothetical protein
MGTNLEGTVCFLPPQTSMLLMQFAPFEDVEY